MNSGPPIFAFLSFIILLSCFPGHVTPAVVTLRSILLYKTHEWLQAPTVYFQCQGGNKTILPDVRQAETIYIFKGEESWQPLTNFSNKKCKRCGIYEKDFLRHDVFDEWELCPSEFAAPDGTYTHVKSKEFNATFSCPECLNLGADHTAASPPTSHSGKKGKHVIVVIVICAAVVAGVIGSMVGYKYWRKRKREKEQARFMKLFEEHDEDDLGLDEML